ncbi:hypothetical protein Tco_0782498 [Tanacetum coccineum]
MDGSARNEAIRHSNDYNQEPTVETNEPKTARKENRAPIIEDWVSESGNNAEAIGSASRGAQQTEPAVGQDGSGGSGGGAVIGLFAGQSGPGGAGVASQGSSYSRWTKRRVQTERISP